MPEDLAAILHHREKSHTLRLAKQADKRSPVSPRLTACPQTPLRDKDLPLAYIGHHLLGFCYMQPKWFITGVHLLRKLYRKEDKREQYHEKCWGITEGSGRSIQSRDWLGMMKWMQKTWSDDSNWMKEREHSRENVTVLEAEETSSMESMNSTKMRPWVSEECWGRIISPGMRSE